MQPTETTVYSETEDIQRNKTMAILAYILFFLPLLAAKDSRYAMYHANQGLVLLLAALVSNFVLGLIPIIGWLLLPIANLILLIFAILGIINAAKGEKKPLPLIGGLQILPNS